MKIAILILCIVLGFVFVNYEPLSKFQSNAQGIHKFEQENFTGALDDFLDAENDFNVANSYYKYGKYQEAIDMYEENEEKSHSIYHNLGNSYYYQAQTEKNSIAKRLRILKKSLSAFKKAEAFEQHLTTLHNKEMVEKEIQDLEEALKKAEEGQNGQEGEDGESGEGEDAESTESEPDQEGEEKGQSESGENEEDTSEKQDESNQSETGKPESSDSSEESGESQSGQEQQGQDQLTEEQAEAIDDYARNLEEAQGEYGEFYNKVYNESQSQFKSIFGDDPFFNNSLLDEQEGKKDW